MTSNTRNRIRGLYWTQEDLDRAIRAVHKNVPIYKAAKDNNIPLSTLRQRLSSNNKKFTKTTHKYFLISDRAEKKLAEHIKTLESMGVELSENTIRKIALNFAKELKPPFSADQRFLDPEWYESFLRKNPILTDNRKVGRTFYTDAGTRNMEKVVAYFHLLEHNLTENNLTNKPSNIYCVDEINLHQRPWFNANGFKVVGKHSYNIEDYRSVEMQTITVVTCCNAEGTFLPPYCLFTNRQQKQQNWEENMPLGSVIRIKNQSDFIEKYWFMDWLENHFIPRKKDGKCLLILDGKESHINSPNLTKIIEENDILLLFLPNHITQYLQPLRRTFFTTLKTHYRDACYEWRKANPTEKLGRHHFGFLFAKAWSRVATTQIRIDFKETGIYPFSPPTIERTCCFGHENFSSESTQDKDNEETSAAITTDPPNTESHINETTCENIVQPVLSTQELIPSATEETSAEIFEVPTNATSWTLLQNVPPLILKTEQEGEQNQEDMQDPLREQSVVSPLFTLERKRQSQVKLIYKSIRKLSKISSDISAMDRQIKKRIKTTSCTSNSNDEESRTEMNDEDSMTFEDFKMIYSSEDESDSNVCVQCYEPYDKSESGWIQCIICNRWSHKTCTLYINRCNICRRMEFKILKRCSS